MRSLTVGDSQGRVNRNPVTRCACVRVVRLCREEIIRSAYLVLLADGRIAGEERKKLKDIAIALQVPEIHFGAILEDLAISLEQQKS